MAKRLDESRQIELAQMTEFMECDEDFLEELVNEAGIGPEGDYEKFRISMARYWLAGARTYIEDVVNTWLERDDDEISEAEDLINIPMTVISPDKIVTVKDKKIITTVTDDKGRVSEAEILPPTPKTEEVGKPQKPWLPAYKDEDKITRTIKEILAETPGEERTRPGFQGWLTASATAALGGKTEPALMLDKVREVLASV